MGLSLSPLTLIVLLTCFTGSVLQCNSFPFHHNNPFRHHHHPRFAKHNCRDALTNQSSFLKARGQGGFLLTRGLLGGGTLASQMVDLVGGYYDAGDNVKFGFPMAFTTTMLSWSVIEFGGLMKGELQNAKQTIRWATDYLLKATAHPDTIYVQVGDANKDHSCWERPEDMDTPRNVFKVDKNSPGSDVAGETAAALAAASLVFRRSDPTYSKLLVRRAIMVFEFAGKYKGAYSAGLKKVVCPFYCSYSGYQDELLWGAAWLHRATKNPNYLNYIQVVNCGGTTVTPKRLRTIAKKQVNYLLGDNPLKMSYMVGYGPRYPQRIHHRGSSLPSVAKHPAKIQCSAGFNFMNSQSPNPNILVGAVIGGPDQHDRFPDQRSDYEQSEPATYINAPIVGALAYLAHSFGQF
ncbi:hypothetical protein CRYUN_Cryun20dG0059700 [Craigia yunnanensis]